MNRNYSKELEQILALDKNKGKKLFLHSCCAPCSSYVLEYLRPFFRITVFYYNPNISEEEEYQRRVKEQKRLIREYNKKTGEGYPIEVMEGDYDKALFFRRVKGLEHCKEGGERCFACYELRLRETAARGRELLMDFFTTTLTISPLKNAAKLNEIGERLAAEYSIPFLPSDFKKKDGYKRSIELSREYDLYRQDYCGCVFSRQERLERQAKEQSLGG